MYIDRAWSTRIQSVWMWGFVLIDLSVLSSVKGVFSVACLDVRSLPRH